MTIQAKSLLILCFITIMPVLSSACSCNRYEETFCRNANSEMNVVIGEIINKSEEGTTIHIIENLANTISEENICLSGKKTTSCAEELTNFNLQDTFILALYEFEPDVWELDGGCGIHFLRIVNNQVKGQITDDVTQQSLTAYKEDFESCLALSTSLSDVSQRETQLSLFPNPATDLLTINTDNGTIQQITVFDSTGQMVMSQDGKNQVTQSLPIHKLGTGLYYIRLSVSDKVMTQQFLKL